MDPDAAVRQLNGCLAGIEQYENGSFTFAVLERKRKDARAEWKPILEALQSTDPQRLAEIREAQPWLRDSAENTEAIKQLISRGYAYQRLAEAALENGAFDRLSTIIGSTVVPLEILHNLTAFASGLWGLELSLDTSCELRRHYEAVWTSARELKRLKGIVSVITRRMLRQQKASESDVPGQLAVIVLLGSVISPEPPPEALPPPDLRELVPPKSPADFEEELRPARWFDAATDGGLYSGLLRVAVRNERLVRSQKLPHHWHHSIDEVCGVYPEYATRLRRAQKAETSANKEKHWDRGD